MLIISQIIFWMILTVSLISLLPLPMNGTYSKWPFFFPFVGVLLFLIYEGVLSKVFSMSNVPIRIDLVIILPSLFLIFFATVVRWIILRKIQRSGVARSGVRAQVLVFSPIIVTITILILNWL